MSNQQIVRKDTDPERSVPGWLATLLAVSAVAIAVFGHPVQSIAAAGVVSAIVGTTQLRRRRRQ